MGGNYVNRPSGRAKEFFGFWLALLLGLLALGILFVCGLLWVAHGGDGNSKEKVAAEQSAASSNGTVVIKSEPANDGVEGRILVSKPQRGEGKRLPGSVGTYFRPAEAEMRYLWDIVRASPHVSANKLYSGVTAKVEFMYLPDQDKVNAAATMLLPKELGAAKKPALLLYGGYVRLSRLVALAAAANEANEMDVQPKLVQMWGELGNQFSESEVNAVLDKTGLSSVTNNPQVVVRAREISCGMLLATLAHEAGHHSLGHLHGDVNADTLEVSRNQEREADSFAASVMSVSPLGKYMLHGELFYYAIDAKVGGGGRTHPYSKERFENLVRANPVLARTLGLGELARTLAGGD